MKNYSEFTNLINEYYHYDDTLEYALGRTKNRQELEKEITQQVARVGIKLNKSYAIEWAIDNGLVVDNELMCDVVSQNKIDILDMLVKGGGTITKLEGDFSYLQGKTLNHIMNYKYFSNDITASLIINAKKINSLKKFAKTNKINWDNIDIDNYYSFYDFLPECYKLGMKQKNVLHIIEKTNNDASDIKYYMMNFSTQIKQKNIFNTNEEFKESLEEDPSRIKYLKDAMSTQQIKDFDFYIKGDEFNFFSEK